MRMRGDFLTQLIQYTTLLSLFLCGTIFADVEIRDTTWLFKQYTTEIDLHDNGYYPGNGANCDGPCTAKNEIEILPDDRAKIIENEFLRVVVTPTIGGRVMSIYHKESKTEQLYHANTAVPYQGPENTFYYNYLIVQGGVLPTFPGPEHSRTWNQRWEIEVVEDTPDRGAIKMSYLDFQDRQEWEFNPTEAFPVEKDSKLFCSIEVFLEKGHAALGYRVHFENKNDHSMGYEYWTLTTLAPGTDLESTLLPKNTLILSPTKKVQLKSDWWSWMSDLVSGAPAEETDYNGGEISWFDKSSQVSNWTGAGIMYAYPYMTKDWWGAINLDNNIGILRIAPHEKTPGMKYWSWGFDAFKNEQPMSLDARDENRSHIELWGGRSREFTRQAEPIHPGPDNAIEWDEYYYPTFELDTIHYANEFGAIEIQEESDGILILLSSTLPHENHTITVSGVAVSAIAPGSSALVLSVTEGCFENGADIQVVVSGDKVIDYQEDIGISGTGECIISVTQEGTGKNYSSSEDQKSSDDISSSDQLSSVEEKFSSVAGNGTNNNESSNTSGLIDDGSDVADIAQSLKNLISTHNSLITFASKMASTVVTVYSVHGSLVASTLVEGNTFDVSSVAPASGAYLIRIKSNAVEGAFVMQIQ